MEKKLLSVGALLEVALSKKCTLLWREEGFVAFAKTMAGVGHLKRICKDGFRVAGALQETCSSEMLGGQAADFLRDVAFWNIFRFAKMILRDRCSTLYDLASLSRGRRRNTFSVLVRGWYEVRNTFAKRVGTRSLALHSTFHSSRTSRRILSFLTLSSSNIEEVSQKCCVFDGVTCKNQGSFAELLRLQACS